ncbi:uncharacterized protein LOC106669351 [Cimex lectularius]|uniref:Uncharacterized protein n=1 Tax=Cimex lectularius TaxID=79782 RepID=A0A8I6RXL9_CIMLE|nr:uncharacterized protein LOC106669351 [Cimex lectularius]
MLPFVFSLIAVVAVTGHPNVNGIEVEVEELFEMVPHDQVLSLGMEYAMSDEQVKSVIKYISEPKFKSNFAMLQGSPSFRELIAEGAQYNIDGLSLANKINKALQLPPISTFSTSEKRTKRSTGEGVIGLIKDTFEIMPISDIKESYRYKVAENESFKVFMDSVLSGEAKKVLKPLMMSKPFLDTKKDLEDMGVPLEEIEKYLEQQLIEFFDLDKQASMREEVPIKDPTE